MKGLLAHLKQTPRIGIRDVFLTVIPALLWLFAVWARPVIINPHCVQQPELCTPDSVNWADRVTLGIQLKTADDLSFTTQNTSGYLAIGVPILWNLASTVGRGLSPALALAPIGTDLVLFLQAAAWNGLLTETSRLIVQRPRPFVFMDAKRAGKNPSNYTSFFSGHTSFSATAGMILFLILLGRNAPRSLLGAAGGAAFALVVLTGLLRMLAARHFLTDVAAGALSGALIAVAVAYFHKPKTLSKTL